MLNHCVTVSCSICLSDIVTLSKFPRTRSCEIFGRVNKKEHETSVDLLGVSGTRLHTERSLPIHRLDLIHKVQAFIGDVIRVDHRIFFTWIS